ncbi:hypothetical protein DICVIV_12672 [Dictyocaulus viviparus]|uniref:Uncharacterized protein n=1 Tax=Dictyocaulus viviparus TaxID=29172 RepID=A0A0D8XG53_DICVI|nr:hypothetical protein DICVIV_12672 [Dictyocaulus viviparus]
MTVMSYDIWKAKCAAEKKRLEAEGKINGIETKIEDDSLISASPPARKRAHTFVATIDLKKFFHKTKFCLMFSKDYRLIING